VAAEHRQSFEALRDRLPDEVHQRLSAQLAQQLFANAPRDTLLAALGKAGPTMKPLPCPAPLNASS